MGSLYSFSTWRNSSSTGVARPKIVTITRNVPRSVLTSSTLPGEIGERAVDDAHVVVLLESHLRARAFGGGRLAVENLIHFVGAERDRLSSAAHKSRHSRGGFYGVPELVVHFHFDEHVAGINQALAGDLFAAAQLDNFFGRDQDLPDLVGETEGLVRGCAETRQPSVQTRNRCE